MLVLVRPAWAREVEDSKSQQNHCSQGI